MLALTRHRPPPLARLLFFTLRPLQPVTFPRATITTRAMSTSSSSCPTNPKRPLPDDIAPEAKRPKHDDESAAVEEDWFMGNICQSQPIDLVPCGLLRRRRVRVRSGGERVMARGSGCRTCSHTAQDHRLPWEQSSHCCCGPSDSAPILTRPTCSGFRPPRGQDPQCRSDGRRSSSSDPRGGAHGSSQGDPEVARRSRSLCRLLDAHERSQR